MLQVYISVVLPKAKGERRRAQEGREREREEKEGLIEDTDDGADT